MDTVVPDLPIERVKCSSKANLIEVARILNEGLGKQFENAAVDVVDCPDLTQAPFCLAAQGLGGHTMTADIGGPPYLCPLVNRAKIYSFESVLENIDSPHLESALMIGASAGPFHQVGKNCELVPNVYLERQSSQANSKYRVVKNNTHFAQIVNDHGLGYGLEKSPWSEFGLLGNLFVSEGKPGKVIRVRCSVRTGQDNFVTSMRNILSAHYGSEVVSLGGVFLIETGAAKLHIMPDFSLTPLNTDDDVNGWLRFFEFTSPLTCLSVFHSHDPGLDLRAEHTHCFSDHNQGGHYHYDTTPQDVSYLAYFNLATEIVRIDRPPITHQIGRD